MLSTVICCASMNEAKAAGARASSDGTIPSRAPVKSAAQISHTDTSKLME